jgi:hypothetical protein
MDRNGLKDWRSTKLIYKNVSVVRRNTNEKKKRKIKNSKFKERKIQKDKSIYK